VFLGISGLLCLRVRVPCTTQLYYMAVVWRMAIALFAVLACFQRLQVVAWSCSCNGTCG
jgi:hypothetical protein